jgi:tetratricopeptide (TPR) repeat protein
MVGSRGNQDSPVHDSNSVLAVALAEVDLRYRRVQLANERASLTLKVLTVVVGVVAAGLVLTLAYIASRSRAVIVEAFDAPPALAQRGFSGKVVSGGLQDALTSIQENVRTSARTRKISNAWTGDIAVQVPQTGVSLGELDRLLRSRLGNETHISGALVQKADNSISLTVRGNGVPPMNFEGSPESLNSLTRQAAEYIYGWFEPRLFAIYLIQNNRSKEALAFVGSAFSRAPPEARPDLAWSWGNLLREFGDYRGSLNKHELALQLDPLYWRAWQGRATALKYLYGDEAALLAGRRMVQVARNAPRNRQPEPRSWFNYQILTEDWTGQITTVRDDARQAGGKGTFSVLSTTFLAEAETHRHDYSGALRTLDMGDQADPALPITRDFISGSRALDEGRLSDALVAFTTFDKQWLKDPKFRFQFDRGPCIVGLAYGLNGHFSEAAKIFDRAKGRAGCAAFRILVKEAAGDRAGADAAFALASTTFPDLPVIYQARAVELIGRGDSNGAQFAFTRAHLLGPTWADPLKGLGDVEAGRGNWKGAAGFYERAAKFAPRWGALHLAWAKSLGAQGLKKLARERLAAALSMDLSDADRRVAASLNRAA